MLQMDQARIEFFLDDGWSLIGRFHQWLSNWPAAAHEQAAMVDLIGGLQSLWATADDFGFRCLSRTSLALEQLLERFCAKNLEFTADRLSDVTLGVGCLQELLLGIEATREEPPFADLGAVVRLERHAVQADWCAPEELTVEVPAIETAIIHAAIIDTATVDTIAEDDSILMVPAVDVVTDLSTVPQQTEITTAVIEVDPPLLTMLEQFVVKIDETCHHLHARMLRDESPYVTTTSRLEHLAQATRKLVEEIVQKSTTAGTSTAEDLFDPWELPATHEELLADLMEDQAATEERVAVDFPDLESIFSDQPATILSVDESALLAAEFEISEAAFHSYRVLIVEESLFFRHLIGMAVRSAGYQSLEAESLEQGLEILEQTSDLNAVLVSSTASSAMAEAFDQFRRTQGVKVISLMSTDDEQGNAIEVDDRVSRSHPQQLITSLDRILGDSAESIRKSA